jgi:isopropylmalate/homocitrate/citramalate synthase
MFRICDVGPRDGLQNLSRVYSTDDRKDLIERLAAADVRHIEAVSFVHPARVPQMADAEEVLDKLPELDGVLLSGLVLNAKGTERALRTRLGEIRFAAIASETFSQRNQNATVNDSLTAFSRTADLVAGSRKRLVGCIGTAFGCPFEGWVPEEEVARIVRHMVRDGAEEIILADTIGVAAPADIRRVVSACLPELKGKPFGVHLHNTRNTGYACAIQAIALGATILDSSIGGLGGCPFAPRATGNIATEDLDYLLTREGISTGLDHMALAEVVGWLKDRLEVKLSGQLADAGWPIEMSDGP